jgi:hypothetical protein
MARRPLEPGERKIKAEKVVRTLNKLPGEGNITKARIVTALENLMHRWNLAEALKKTTPLQALLQPDDFIESLTANYHKADLPEDAVAEFLKRLPDAELRALNGIAVDIDRETKAPQDLMTAIVGYIDLHNKTIEDETGRITATRDRLSGEINADEAQDTQIVAALKRLIRTFNLAAELRQTAAIEAILQPEGYIGSSAEKHNQAEFTKNQMAKILSRIPATQLRNVNAVITSIIDSEAAPDELTTAIEKVIESYDRVIASQSERISPLLNKLDGDAGKVIEALMVMLRAMKISLELEKARFDSCDIYALLDSDVLINECKRSFLNAVLTEQGMLDILSRLSRDILAKLNPLAQNQADADAIIEAIDAIRDDFIAKIEKIEEGIQKRVSDYESSLSWTQWLAFQTQRAWTYMKHRSIIGIFDVVTRWLVGKTKQAKQYLPESTPTVIKDNIQDAPPVFVAGLAGVYCGALGFTGPAMLVFFTYIAKGIVTVLNNETHNLLEGTTTKHTHFKPGELYHEWEGWDWDIPIPSEMNVIRIISLTISAGYAFVLLEPLLLIYTLSSMLGSLLASGTVQWAFKLAERSIKVTPNAERWIVKLTPLMTLGVVAGSEYLLFELSTLASCLLYLSTLLVTPIITPRVMRLLERPMAVNPIAKQSMIMLCSMLGLRLGQVPVKNYILEGQVFSQVLGQFNPQRTVNGTCLPPYSNAHNPQIIDEQRSALVAALWPRSSVSVGDFSATIKLRCPSSMAPESIDDIFGYAQQLPTQVGSHQDFSISTTLYEDMAWDIALAENRDGCQLLFVRGPQIFKLPVSGDPLVAALEFGPAVIQSVLQ